MALDEKIDAMVRKAIQDDKLPGGFTLAIVKQGQPIVLRAYGFADRETNRPMPVDALFPIGSVTKTITATLAVKLAAKGQVSLDESVLRYLPSSVTLNAELTKAPVTLDALLTHRAGFPKDHTTRRNLKLNLAGGFDPTIADPRSFSRVEFYRGLQTSGSRGAVPGQRHYSNFGYHFAAHILELASGRSMEQLVGSEIAGPLGMPDTHFNLTAIQRGRIPIGYALDDEHDRSVRVPPWETGEVVGGAFLHSTASDLARFVALAMNSCASAAFLGGSVWDARMFRPKIEYIDGDTWRGQALAWQISNFGPYGQILRHSGDSDGHNAYVAVSRARGLGIVLLTNNDSGANDYLGNELLLLLMQHDREQAEALSTR